MALGYNQKRSQLTNLKLQKTDNSDVVSNISYDYYNGGGGSGGNNGRVRYITDHLDGNYSVDVGYDDHNRLTQYGSYRSYTYDAWNNLLSVSSSNGVGEAPNYTLSYATNGSGAPSTNRINNSGYTYDSAGNVTNDGSLAYAYDAAGRLKTAGTNNSCEYDGDGRKVKQVSGGYPLFYLWSSVLGEPVVELDGFGGVYRAYVLSSGGQMLAVQSYDGGFYWLHTDHLGNGRKLTNTSGSVTYRAEFDPHGQMLYEWQSSGQTYLNSHKFTGYERDWATNLNYAKARTYNHNRARFLQPDPLGIGAADVTDPQSLNRYSYVGNDPANFTDPTGLFCYARYEVTTTYGNGQVIGQTWEFIGIFCDSSGFGYYQPIDGGGQTQDPHPNEPHPQKRRNPSCHEFVDELVNRVFDSKFFTKLGQGVAMELEAIVNPYEKYMPRGRHFSNGFKLRLIDHHQLGDVYRHVLFVAGTVLAGDNWIRGWFMDYDQQQANSGRNESSSEVRGNEAGKKVGGLMSQAWDSKMDAVSLRTALRGVLCGIPP